MIGDIRLCEKYILTIEEAAAYFHIGEAKIRQLISNNKLSDFVLMNGSRVLIKRKKFEKFIDSVSSI